MDSIPSVDNAAREGSAQPRGDEPEPGVVVRSHSEGLGKDPLELQKRNCNSVLATLSSLPQSLAAQASEQQQTQQHQQSQNMQMQQQQPQAQQQQLLQQQRPLLQQDSRSYNGLLTTFAAPSTPGADAAPRSWGLSAQPRPASLPSTRPVNTLQHSSSLRPGMQYASNLNAAHNSWRQEASIRAPPSGLPTSMPPRPATATGPLPQPGSMPGHPAVYRPGNFGALQPPAGSRTYFHPPPHLYPPAGQGPTPLPRPGLSRPASALNITLPGTLGRPPVSSNEDSLAVIQPQQGGLAPYSERQGGTAWQPSQTTSAPGNASASLTNPGGLCSPTDGHGLSRKQASKKARDVALSARKHCNCKNSRCLKLYCECFASGRYCLDCNCVSCCNNQENETFRQAAVETILDRNPNAFRPKILERDGTAMAVMPAWHNKGCNCKKSNCLKKYCECFQASIYCSDNCKCVDCHNYNFALGPKGSSPTSRRPSSGVRERPSYHRISTTSPLPNHASRTWPLHKINHLGEADLAPGPQALSECMQEFQRKNGLEELTALLLSVAREEAEKQESDDGAPRDSTMIAAVDESDASSLKRRRENDGLELEGPVDANERVEAAILRDFGKALSKLAKKIERRETELQDVARRQQTEREKHDNVNAALFSPPLAARISHDWVPPSASRNGSLAMHAPAAPNSFQQTTQGMAQQVGMSQPPQLTQLQSQQNSAAILNFNGPIAQQMQSPQHTSIPIATQAHAVLRQAQPALPIPGNSFVNPNSQGAAHMAYLPPNSLAMQQPGQRLASQASISPSQNKPTTSVLASLLHQNRGNAANALSNRPSPIKQSRDPPPSEAAVREEDQSNIESEMRSDAQDMQAAL